MACSLMRGNHITELHQKISNHTKLYINIHSHMKLHRVKRNYSKLHHTTSNCEKLHKSTKSAYFIKMVVEVKASGPPHVTKLWLGASNGMLLWNTFTPTKPQDHHMSQNCGWGQARACSLWNTFAPTKPRDHHMSQNCGWGQARACFLWNTFAPTKSVFCASWISWRSWDCHRADLNVATLSCGDFTWVKIVACLSVNSISTYCYLSPYLFLFPPLPHPPWHGHRQLHTIHILRANTHTYI